MPVHVWRIARQLSISERTLNIRFKAETGISVGAFLHRERIACVKRLLEETDLPIAEVALVAGYASERSLYRAWKRETDLTPGEYRSKSRES